jgi:FixJ family two-component response regulator/GGDEF domain-containing protein
MRLHERKVVCTLMEAGWFADELLKEDCAVAEKVLFVDDEMSALDGFRRILRHEFQVSTAEGGEKGLAMMQRMGPFAVVVSDMRMPGMNGAEFLAKAREKAPDTVRMLLTGHADLDTAIEAVNQGNIFRFLTKPCEKDVLVKAIQSGVAQYRATAADKEVVKKAQLIGRTNTEWDAADMQQCEELELTSGLPGPGEAKKHLETVVGREAACYVAMIKLPLLKTIEERYGEAAAGEYLNGAVQWLAMAQKPADRMFQWSRDVLMAVMPRQSGPAMLRLEFARLTSTSREHVLNVDGRKIMSTISLAFDLLAVSQFKNVKELIEAFDAKLVKRI